MSEGEKKSLTFFFVCETADRSSFERVPSAVLSCSIASVLRRIEETLHFCTVCSSKKAVKLVERPLPRKTKRSTKTQNQWTECGFGTASSQSTTCSPSPGLLSRSWPAASRSLSSSSSSSRGRRRRESFYLTVVKVERFCLRQLFECSPTFLLNLSRALPRQLHPIHSILELRHDAATNCATGEIVGD